MIEKLKRMIVKNKEVLLYLVFGVLTTLVNILGYALFTRVITLDEYVANVIAWIISVLFAFITNKLYVFESKDRSIKKILRESVSFFAFRFVSLGFDMGAMYVMISLLHWDDFLAKILSNIIVVILNYIFSKLFVFQNNK